MVTLCGCTEPTPTTHVADSADNLQEMVGQKVTLQGEYELSGKLGPFVLTSIGQVYILGARSLDGLFDGKTVTVKGVLRHRSGDVGSVPEGVTAMPDHYYCDHETAQLAIVDSPN